MSRSKWFKGFLYAESVFKELGPLAAPRVLNIAANGAFDAFDYTGDFSYMISEFDKGMFDYLDLMRHRELIK